MSLGVFFTGVLSYSFTWNLFICLLIFFDLLYVSVKLGESYIFWSWRLVLVWEWPYAVCSCPVALVGEMDLKWSQVASSSKVHWWLLPLWEVGPESEGLQPKSSTSQGFSWASCWLLPCQGVGSGSKCLDLYSWAVFTSPWCAQAHVWQELWSLSCLWTWAGTRGWSYNLKPAPVSQVHTIVVSTLAACSARAGGLEQEPSAG